MEGKLLENMDICTSVHVYSVKYVCICYCSYAEIYPFAGSPGGSGFLLENHLGPFKTFRNTTCRILVTWEFICCLLKSIWPNEQSMKHIGTIIYLIMFTQKSIFEYF